MFERKELTYDFGALHPYIDKATMEEHYNAHYKKYTDNLNEAVAEEEIPEDVSIQDILRKVKLIDSKKIRNNAGGFYNHQLYFENISPNNNSYESADQELKRMIFENFGGYQQLKSNFRSAGMDIFGSGWVWLISPTGNFDTLKIVKTKNQDNPLMSCDCKILLGMDVWEHAYYLKHKADRRSYIDDFFKVIDWKIVSERV